MLGLGPPGSRTSWSGGRSPRLRQRRAGVTAPRRASSRGHPRVMIDVPEQPARGPGLGITACSRAPITNSSGVPAAMFRRRQMIRPQPQRAAGHLHALKPRAQGAGVAARGVRGEIHPGERAGWGRASGQDEARGPRSGKGVLRPMAARRARRRASRSPGSPSSSLPRTTAPEQQITLTRTPAECPVPGESRTSVALDPALHPEARRPVLAGGWAPGLEVYQSSPHDQQ